MGLLLVIVGFIVWLLGHFLIGIILIAVGVALIFIPQAPYGYGWYRGRRRAP